MSNDHQSPKGTGGAGYMWHGARNPPAEPTASFKGKTVLITGANIGLGYQAAIKFARLGAARLVLGVRSLTKGEAAKQSIASEVGYDASLVAVHQVELGSFTSVSKFAEEISTQYDRIDVAVLNAGVAMPVYRKSQEGWEMSLQVNVLSTALLGIKLLPKLRATATKSSDLVYMEVVGSVAYTDVKSEWVTDMLKPGETILQHYNKPENFDVNKQYHISKLLAMFVLEALAGACQSPGSKGLGPGQPVVLASCPGMCRTNMGREFGMGMRAFMAVFQLFVARTAEQGSRSLVSAATTGKAAHGRMWMNDTFNDCEPMLTASQWQELQAKTWNDIMGVLKKHETGLRLS